MPRHPRCTYRKDKHTAAGIKRNHSRGSRAHISSLIAMTAAPYEICSTGTARKARKGHIALQKWNPLHQ